METLFYCAKVEGMFDDIPFSLFARLNGHSTRRLKQAGMFEGFESAADRARVLEAYLIKQYGAEHTKCVVLAIEGRVVETELPQ